MTGKFYKSILCCMIFAKCKDCENDFRMGDSVTTKANSWTSLLNLFAKSKCCIFAVSKGINFGNRVYKINKFCGNYDIYAKHDDIYAEHIKYESEKNTE